MTIPPDLPESLSPLRNYVWHRIDIGQSAASVWRIALAEGTMAFLKTETLHPLAEVPGEIERLSWLTGMGFKSPRVIEVAQSDDRVWLLMSAVRGRDLTHLVDRPADLVAACAQGLKRLHALDPAQCPFDHGIDARLAEAEQRLAAGLIDDSEFDLQRRNWTGRQLLDWLHANRPPEGEPIVTHGYATLLNLMAEDGRFSGIVDCGRLGRADPWQDLALACRSITSTIGQQHVPPFLAAYGADWDEAKYRYYCTLDEMF